MSLLRTLLLLLIAAIVPGGLLLLIPMALNRWRAAHQQPEVTPALVAKNPASDCPS